MDNIGTHPAHAEGPSADQRPPRVFVGIKVAPEVAGELARLAEGLERFPVRLIAPADIHLTLVPPWNEASIPGAIERLRPVVNRFQPFALTFEHVGYGPRPRRPRLLWAACMASDEIVALHAALLEAYGQSEERPFRPHVTLARIRGNGAAIARAHPIDRQISLAQQVDSVELFRSPPPGERGYRILASLRLGTIADSA
jgi:2'-5' RNA ligase